MGSILGMILSLPFLLGIIVALFVWPMIRRMAAR